MGDFITEIYLLEAIIDQNQRNTMYVAIIANDNDILLNLITSVCTTFKPKGYKLYLPPVFFGSDAFKYAAESKYLGFSFCDSKAR